MMIKHIGQSMVPTPSRHIFLKDVLHVPHATHNLVFVHHLNSDNDVFLKLHLNFFSLRIGTRDAQFYSVHVKPGCIPSPHLPGSPFGKMCFSSTRLSTEQWHGRLGHPWFKIVSGIIRDNNLPFVCTKFVVHVCDACRQAKSHQLSFPKSISVSTLPLELFSDV
jgi:hypothetical protein